MAAAIGLPWRWALAIFGAALALRLLHVWQMSATPYFAVLMGDARGYDQWAMRLAGGDWIGTDVFYQAPLYPYFLGVVYAVAGHDLLAVRVVQAAIGSLSAVLVAWAAARLFSTRAGIIAGALLAFWAPAIFFDGLIQKSVLDVAFVSAAVALIAAILTGGSDRRGLWLALGAATACLSLTRENALVLIAVLGAWAVASGPHRTAGRAGAVAAFAVGVALVLGPVVLRNYAISGDVYLTTSQFGPNFYIGNNPGADGSYASLRFGRGSPEFERLDATELAERAAGPPADTGRRVELLDRRGRSTSSTGDPGAWLALEARKAVLLVNAAEMLDTESQETLRRVVVAAAAARPGSAHFGVLVPLAVAGIWRPGRIAAGCGCSTRSRRPTPTSVVAFYVFARYRFPLVPLLVLFAAAGVARLGEALAPPWPGPAADPRRCRGGDRR